VLCASAIVAGLIVGVLVRRWQRRQRTTNPNTEQLLGSSKNYAKGGLPPGFHQRQGSSSVTNLESEIHGLGTFDDLVQTRSVEATWCIPFELLALGPKIGAGGKAFHFFFANAALQPEFHVN
jgi:hypothetical protein